MTLNQARRMISNEKTLKLASEAKLIEAGDAVRAARSGQFFMPSERDFLISSLSREYHRRRDERFAITTDDDGNFLPGTV